MPELPEVETVRRGLEPSLVGVRIASVDLRRGDLRFPFPRDFVKRLTGQRVVSLGRRAKYLTADLGSAEVLVMHLGMTGRFTIQARQALREPGSFYHGGGREHGTTAAHRHRAHDHVVFHLSDGTDIIYSDPRRFGFMLIMPRAELADHPLFKGLGLEPLGNELDGAALAHLFRGRKAPLKAALLDQRLVAGLGNIYVCEALHRAGLSPRRAAGTIATRAGKKTDKAERLAVAIRDVLGEAVAAGGSTLRDYARADGTVGEFQHAFRVYDREGEACTTLRCTGTISRTVQSGRATFHCARCQR